MLTYEIAGCGGVLTSQCGPEQNAVLPDGEAAIYFTSFEDIAPKLSFYIKNSMRLEALRTKACSRIQHNTYGDRAYVLTQALIDVTAGRPLKTELGQ